MAKLFLFAALGALGFLTQSSAQADMIFESGTLGQTGVTYDDLLDETVRATNVTSNVFTGVRFQLNEPTLTSHIGGHFIGFSSGTFFGAILALDDENDFPDSGDLSTSDVLGNAELSFQVSSTEVFGDLNLTLQPGWYALVFGSGLFGADSNGAAPRNGTDIGSPAYIGFQPGSGWGNLINPIFRNHRFVVRGSIIPEPTTLILALSASLFFAQKKTLR